MNNIDQLKDWINICNSIVAITGAGFSTESGIPDFRGNEGVYKDTKNYGYPPEIIVSKDFFYTNPEVFYNFCKNELVHQEARPNKAHLALFEMEKQGNLSAIITQNIDGLHQMAGNSNVIELHGTVMDYYCTNCNHYHSLDYVMEQIGAPNCEQCGALLKPDAILFGELLKPERFLAAQKHIAAADLLIVAGTSLNVKTASHLMSLFKGQYLVIINDSPTPYDQSANLVIHEKVGRVFDTLVSYP